MLARAPVVPPVGFAFSNVTAPLDVDFDATKIGPKTGRSKTHNVLGLFAWGDGSTQAAARNGGLKVIDHADYRSFGILGIYSSFTTIVYGE